MLIGTFLLILGWGIPRKILWHRYWHTLYIYTIHTHVKCMHRIVLPSLACLAVPCFSPLSHKCNDFRQKVTEHKHCIFSINFDWNIGHSKKNRTRYTFSKICMQYTCHSYHILMKPEFCRQIFRKVHQISWKSALSAAILFMRTDVQIDDRHDGDNSRLSQFLERPWKAPMMETSWFVPGIVCTLK